MSSCVLDASALVAALIDDSAKGRWAEAIILEHNLVAPELVLAETTNLLRRLELVGTLGKAVASRAFADLMALEVDLFPFAPFADRVWQLRDNLTAYNAWYVALAEELRAPLATLDGKLARSRGLQCEFLLAPGES